MDITQWWPRLAPGTQAWLMENNGDDVTAAVAEQIREAGGRADADQPLSDSDVDWIEAVANDEVPQ